jgi:hypothetical protein
MLVSQLITQICQQWNNRNKGKKWVIRKFTKAIIDLIDKAKKDSTKPNGNLLP